jgi:hypothetical protein
MARLYVFECKCGEFAEAKRIEYVPPSNSTELSPGRFKIDLSKEPDHDGYPNQTLDCPKCNSVITSKQFDITKVPPVYFNYMGSDD